MARIPPLDVNRMTAAQHSVFDETVSGRRGHAPGQIMAWLRSPELAGRAQKLGEFVRYETTLPPRLSELAILVIARVWSCQYEWAMHKREALRAGVDANVIEEIAHRRPPRFKEHDEAVVHDFALELSSKHFVSDDLYSETLAALGERAMVELAGLLGYYVLVAMTLNAFEVDLPDGLQPELED